MDFYRCKHCGNIIAYVENRGVNVVCCGEEMQLLHPNTVDAAVEKHVPVVEVDGNVVTVTVGAAPHPMTEEHHIAWISLHTEKGNQRKPLPSTGEPKAVFSLTDDDRALAAYEYCNIHGLWKAEM